MQLPCHLYFAEILELRDYGWHCFIQFLLFCNAGFDLMGVKSPFSSLTLYAGEPLINFPIMLLIIIGGIGFFNVG